MKKKKEPERMKDILSVAKLFTSDLNIANFNVFFFLSKLDLDIYGRGV